LLVRFREPSGVVAGVPVRGRDIVLHPQNDQQQSGEGEHGTGPERWFSPQRPASGDMPGDDPVPFMRR
jgi:hypothetical protein